LGKGEGAEGLVKRIIMEMERGMEGFVADGRLGVQRVGHLGLSEGLD
jgi:hypothetical protein